MVAPPLSTFAILALCVGLGRTLDGVLSDSLKSNVAKSLTRVNRGADSQFGVFDDILESLLGPRYFSLRCFGVSALLSVLSVLFFYFAWLFFHRKYLDMMWNFWRVPSAHVYVLVLLIVILAVNTIPDYLSLLETRLILKRLRQTPFLDHKVLLLVLDLILTAAISSLSILLLAVLFIGFFFFANKTQSPGELFGLQSLPVWFKMGLLDFTLPFRALDITTQLDNGDKIGFFIPPIGMFYYAGFTTSIWLWLFLFSRQITKVARVFVKSWNIEKYPLMFVGLVGGITIVLGLVALRPFMQGTGVFDIADLEARVRGKTQFYLLGSVQSPSASWNHALRRLSDGSWASFFTMRNSADSESGEYVVLCRSTDHGKEWSKPEVILKLAGRRCVLQCVLVSREEVTVYASSFLEDLGDWESVRLKSQDSGKSWSGPELLGEFPEQVMLHRTCQTTWGEVLVPYSSRAIHSTSSDISAQERARSGVLISSDGGRTWKVHEGSLPECEGQYYEIVELSGGRLALFVRVRGESHVLRSDSKDRGRTWSLLYPTDIASIGGDFCFVRCRDGRIALIHNVDDTVYPYDPISIWISEDDALTWSHKTRVVSFPACLCSPDAFLEEDEGFVNFIFGSGSDSPVCCRTSME